MEICIKIENPNEGELELIDQLTKLEIEKRFQEQKLMEEKLIKDLPIMYQKMMMDRDKIICEDREVNLRKDK